MNIRFTFASHTGNGSIETREVAFGYTLGDLAREEGVALGTEVNATIKAAGAYNAIRDSNANTQIRDGDTVNFIGKNQAGA